MGMTSYSDYMRCLAAKYNNNQPGEPTLSPALSPAQSHIAEARKKYFKDLYVTVDESGKVQSEIN